MEEKRCKCRADLKRFIILSRRRIGIWVFWAWFTRRLCWRWSQLLRPICLLTAPYEPSLSVTITRADASCTVTNLCKIRLAALVSWCFALIWARSLVFCSYIPCQSCNIRLCRWALCAKIAPCPRMSSPLALLQFRKFLFYGAWMTAPSCSVQHHGPTFVAE